MTARDVIERHLNQKAGLVLTSEANADAILAALDKAGYAVVPKSLLAKVPNDPPMSGLPQVDLSKIDFTAAKETP